VTPPVAIAALGGLGDCRMQPMAIAGPAVKLRLVVLVVSFVFGPALVWKGPLWKTVITFGTAAIALTLLVAAIDTIPNGEIRGGREHWSGLARCL
jgi:TRAP-type uncharacterized transport system fused permease subunit